MSESKFIWKALGDLHCLGLFCQSLHFPYLQNGDGECKTSMTRWQDFKLTLLLTAPKIDTLEPKSSSHRQAGKIKVQVYTESSNRESGSRSGRTDKQNNNRKLGGCTLENLAKRGDGPVYICIYC